MLFKNIAGQKLAIYAHDTSADAPKTGDASNITAQISIDGGATAATNDTNPTELDATDAKGIYIFDLTQAETNGDLIILSAVSSTADVQIEPVIAYTGGVSIEYIQRDLQSATDLKAFADSGYDPATNKIQGVVLVDTTTTNSDMRGTDNALLAASAPANFGDLSITPATGRVDIAAWLGQAVTLSSTTLLPEVDSKSISDNVTAADSLEDVYDDTTYTVPNMKTFWENNSGLTTKTVDNVGSTAIRTGTAQAGAAGTITLDASASSTDDTYNGSVCIINGGTGVGQCRAIVDYDGSTKVATITPNWTTSPDNTSTFEIQPASSILLHLLGMAAGKLAFSGNVVTVYDWDNTTTLFTNAWDTTGRTRS